MHCSVSSSPFFVSVVLLLLLLLSLLLLLLLLVLFVTNSRTSHQTPEKFIERLPSFSFPLVVFQTWKTKINLPKPIVRLRKWNERLNPNFEFVLMDDDDIMSFLKKEYPQEWKRYRRINPHYGPCRADFFRYLIIYHYGGIYLDIKTRLRVPFEKWCSNLLHGKTSGLISKWDNQSLFEWQNWHIMFHRHHPVLHRMIQQIMEHIDHATIPTMYTKGKQDILRLTGPHQYTYIVDEYLSQSAADNMEIKDVHPYMDYAHGYQHYDCFDELGCTGRLYKELQIRHYTKIHEPLFLLKDDPLEFHHQTPQWLSSVFELRDLSSFLKSHDPGLYMMRGVCPLRKDLEEVFCHIHCVIGIQKKTHHVFLIAFSKTNFQLPLSLVRSPLSEEEQICYYDDTLWKILWVSEEDSSLYYDTKKYFQW